MVEASTDKAVYDPALAAGSLIRPVRTMDSHYWADRTGIVVCRGLGDRLVAYFRVDPRFASTGLARRLTVDYVDDGTGSWFLEYVARTKPMDDSSPWTSSARVGLETSGERRSARFDLTSARWTGAVNGADFRIVVVDPDIDRFRIGSITLDDPGDGSAERTENLRGVWDRYVFPSRHFNISFSEPENMLASIVIPVFNELPYTLDCLRAVMEFTPAIYEVVVVNNGSTDSTGDVLSGIPGLRVVSNPSNRGFAVACNQGAQAARGQWIVFLNNDTIPQPGWLTAMIACVQGSDRVGAVGCKLVFPQTGEVQCAGTSFGDYLLPVEEFRYSSPDDPAVRVTRQVEAVSGACILTPLALFLDLGGFDEQFVNGFEDSDYCLRLRQKEYKVLYCASSTVLHYQSATAGRYDVDNDRSNVTRFRKKWHAYVARNLEDPACPTIRGHSFSFRFDAQSQGIHSQTGKREAGTIECVRTRHATGHCFYGPNIRVDNEVTARIIFCFELSKISDGHALLTMDVYDSVEDNVVCSRTVYSDEVSETSYRLSMEVPLSAGQILEFRVFWHGGCDVAVSHVEVESKTSEPNHG
jgi:GT2 family glycosyltransferase